MTRSAREEYLAAVRARYRAARKAEKSRILEEFCRTAGMHRKAAIRRLAERAGPRPTRPGRPRRYGSDVAVALVQVWEVGDRMCGKLLAAAMPELLASLERHDELKVSPEVRALLLEISPASIDRLLQRYRNAGLRQPQRKTTAAGALKSQVPVKTWSEWKGVTPGSLQADLVLHCGESTGGFYLTTLTMVDIASGWTELQPVWGLGKERVGGAVHLIRQRLPFKVQAIHTDNGSEFINGVLVPWCVQEKISLSRGRSYRKNDQAYVEQKNWQSVRRLVGYDRLSSQAAYKLLQALYPLLRAQSNFFRPVRKLVGKHREGAKVSKQYDEPATPYQRLLASSALSEDERRALIARCEAANPAELKRRIDGLLRQLWRLGQQERTPEKENVG